MASAGMLPVSLADGPAAPCRAAGFPALIALTGRCAAPQFVCHGGRRAADLPGDGSVCVTLSLEMPDSTSFFTLKVLSLLAFCRLCDVILAVHSDCPPLADVVWELHSTISKGPITSSGGDKLAKLHHPHNIPLQTINYRTGNKLTCKLRLFPVCTQQCPISFIKA